MVALLLLCGACAPRPAQVAPHAPVHPVIADARAAAAAHDFERADSLLARAAEVYPDAPDATEVLYWRALVHLDPANTAGSASVAADLLDEYLERLDGAARHPEARALRQLAAVLDSVQAAAGARPETTEVPQDTLRSLRDRERELERENARLREQLERSNAELERIRRRLAAPPGS